MLSSFGQTVKVSVFGGSHEPAIGVTIEGLPKGQKIDMDRLQRFLARRAPGNNAFSTDRKEPDIAIVKAGLHGGVTFGPPVTIIIENKDTNPSDYRTLKNIPRPSHADYTARLKYGEHLNMSGGGPFSGRMTAPLCIAGAIAIQVLESHGIKIGAHIFSIADIKDEPFDAVHISKEKLERLANDPFPVISENAGLAMQEAILVSRETGDSLGGVVECCAIGVPAGIGGPMYDGVESALSQVFFGIPAVKGVEFGAGFQSTRLKGSENNDAFYFDGEEENRTVKTKTNNHGGILGGITSGMPIIARLAFKPTPSISLEQDSVDLETGQNTKLVITGRHDPCIVPRAVPVVEAAMAVGLLDLILSDK
ncbi:MAG: chorismate synthase [Clostridiales bacterium]|nr:chorismate synthase [Clostridiales bacterium]